MESKNRNYYFIEKVAEEDLIGFEEYLNALNEVIRNGATFIGLISDYGTGKSSLLNMLSNNIAYKVVFINLWNYQKEEISTLDIHKIFLHQLIDKLDINNKNYFKKKINQNYNIIDFCIKKRKYTWYIYFIDLCLFIIFVFSSFPILMKFILFLIALFLFGFYKPLISFNKNDSFTRKIDENDTKDLFAEIINEYFKNKENKNIKLLICLEELDRYNNYELVVEYLKEFYKFYSENSNNRNISFIVSVKSASQLIELSQDNIELKEFEKKYITEYVKDLYEKIFDFILNLNFINIQDYDSILIALLSNKELPEGIKFNKANLTNWRWLYNGKNIRIRDIKHRFNFAINLYLSAKESGLESPDIKKCLFISYLEDEFNLFYNKLVNENLIGKILIDYVNKKLDNEKYKLSDNEYKILKDALDSKLISIDYNYYFYKYPKVKESFNLNEYILYNAVFYDEDSLYINNAIKKLSDDQIYKIINKRIDELLLPKVLFRYPKLFMIAYYKLNKSFEYTIDKRFNIMNNFENFKEYYSYIKNLRKNYHKNLLSEYFKKYIKNIKDLSIDNILDLRKKIVFELKEYSIVIKDLFYNDYDIISDEEVLNINDLKIILELTNFNKISDKTIDAYIKVIKTKKYNNKKYILDFFNKISNIENISDDIYKNAFYSLNWPEYKFNEDEYRKILNLSKEKLNLFNPNNFNDFVKKTNFYCEHFDNFYLKILNENCEKKNVESFAKILNNFQCISLQDMQFLNEYKNEENEHEVFPFNKKNREEFYKNGFYQYYILSTYLNENLFEIEDDKYENLSSYYVKLFVKNDFDLNKIGLKMKQYLYQHTDFSKIEYNKLKLFNDFPLTEKLILAILNCKDLDFINNYLSNVKLINKKEEKTIYTLIGNYDKENKILNKKSKNNLKTLTNNKFLLKELDNRRKMMS